MNCQTITFNLSLLNVIQSVSKMSAKLQQSTIQYIVIVLWQRITMGLAAFCTNDVSRYIAMHTMCCLVVPWWVEGRNAHVQPKSRRIISPLVPPSCRTIIAAQQTVCICTCSTPTYINITFTNSAHFVGTSQLCILYVVLGWICLQVFNAVMFTECLLLVQTEQMATKLTIFEDLQMVGTNNIFKVYKRPRTH